MRDADSVRQRDRRGRYVAAITSLTLTLASALSMSLVTSAEAFAAPQTAPQTAPKTDDAGGKKPGEKSAAPTVGSDVRAALAKGGTDVLVAFDPSEGMSKIMAATAKSQDKASKAAAAAAAADAYAKTKKTALGKVGGDVRVVRDFDYLPIQMVHIASTQQLDRLIATEGVAAVHLPRQGKVDTDHLAAIHQPEAVSAGFDGSGMAVAILDTGVDPDYSDAAVDLGDCGFGWGMGACRITSFHPLSGEDSLDVDAENHHGTNVAGIVAQVSPKAKIHVYQVADSEMTIAEGDVLGALNAITRDGASLGIRAVNMSFHFGSEQYSTSECSGTIMDYAFLNLRGQGILPVLAAGNGATTYGWLGDPTVHVGVNYPACAPGAIRVGAVDTSDMSIPSFSQGGPLLTVRAPGVSIKAGGSTLSGTSMAAPHVAGAIANVAEANPDAMAQQLARAITTSRTTLYDGKDNTSKPLLDVERAATAVQSSQAMISGLGCADNTLPANDDGSTGSVQIPFPINFFGRTYESLYVNNNGNVTFLQPMSTYTPFTVTASIPPMIAPFFADVDTRGAGSKPVTYGVTTYGSRTAFCVNWDEVGYYSYGTNKLNSFQLLLVDRSDVGAGDFDIVMNYDEVTWEAGSASGGSNGLGGTPAGAGYSAGDGNSQHFFRFEGSMTHLALLDSSADTGLVNGQRGAQLNGRYVFPVRNGAAPGSGKISGTVKNSADAPLAAAAVEACPDFAGASCVTGVSSATGHYSIVGLAQGTWHLNAMPPSSSYLQPTRVNGIQMPQGGDLIQDLVLQEPQAIPAGTTITSHGTSGGMPVLYWNDELTLTTQACSGGSGTYKITGSTGELASGPLTETPANSGTYQARVAPLYPNTGRALVEMTIHCPSGSDTQVQFGVYIDPSGRVLDTAGRPVSGATVSLYRADSATGPFEVLPDGSSIMSPSQRSNPMTTVSDGIFHWDVLSGYYVVRASAPGCHAPGSDAEYVESSVLQIPPPALGIDLTLECPGLTRSAQTITFDALPDRTYGDASFTLAATSTSGLPVSFTAAGSCSVDGATAALTGVGDCSVTAHQAGDQVFEPATDVSQSFTIAPKALTVSANDQSSDYSDLLGTLGHSVIGLVGSDTTTGEPSCSTTATSESAAGEYPITCTTGTFSAGPNYAVTFTAGMYTVTKESTAVEYTGDTALETTSSTSTTTGAVLKAHLNQEADGHAGDLTKAKVRFLLYRGADLTASPVVVSDVAVNVEGDASASAQLAADLWAVKVVVEDANGYWIADPFVVGTLNITIPATGTNRRTVGGGWITYEPSSNGKANFGFTVTTDKKGGPRGNAVFIWRGTDGYTYLAKTTSWSNGGLSFFPRDPALARFVARGVLQKLDAQGVVVDSTGNIQFEGYAFDGDLRDPRAKDGFAIRVTDPAGEALASAGTQGAPVPLGGGSISVKSA